MRFSVYILAVILLWAAAAVAAPFDSHTAKGDLDTLCSRQFAGRKSGDPEMAACEHWAAGSFARFGLEAGGSDGFLQPFPILSNHEEKAELELINDRHGRKIYTDGEDFDLITNSGSGKIKAEVVFAGYGISEPGKGWDDFAGLDLKGKIALIYKAVPGPDRTWEKQLTRDYKVERAVERGAVAVMFIHDEDAIAGAAIHKEAFFPKVPVIIVSDHVVEDVLRDTGRRWDNLKKRLEKAPCSFATHSLVKIETKLKYDPKAKACNVIGVLPGSDPALKSEWIVVGGHMDHNGVNAVGDVFYGADDNASGASVVMELAHGFASVYPTPRRSLMFIEFAGEEQGLLGSQWYVDHPTVPLGKVAAMFNFDMCGMGNGGVGFGGSEHFPEIWQQYQSQMDSAAKANLTVSTIWHGGSDNSSFEDQGVPTFNYWSTGDHPFYHHQEDLPGKIADSTLGNVGQAASNFIQYLANWEKPLITENYREHTWAYSACSINLKGYNRPLDHQAAECAAALKQIHTEKGLKCMAARIGAQDPCGDVDFWRQFCKDNDFVWAEGKDDVHNAMRRQKLALLPVISDLAAMDSEGVDLRNLAAMGVKVAAVWKAGADSARLAAAVKQAADLGMVFICDESLACFIPASSKRIVMASKLPNPLQLPQSEDMDKVRLVFPYDSTTAGNGGFNPDSAGTTQRVVTLDPWQNGLLPGSLIKLEQAGFKGQEITYMLGENVVELLP